MTTGHYAWRVRAVSRFKSASSNAGFNEFTVAHPLEKRWSSRLRLFSSLSNYQYSQKVKPSNPAFDLKKSIPFQSIGLEFNTIFFIGEKRFAGNFDYISSSSDNQRATIMNGSLQKEFLSFEKLTFFSGLGFFNSSNLIKSTGNSQAQIDYNFFELPQTVIWQNKNWQVQSKLSLLVSSPVQESDNLTLGHLIQIDLSYILSKKFHLGVGFFRQSFSISGENQQANNVNIEIVNQGPRLFLGLNF
jgi:hypothetical protein